MIANRRLDCESVQEDGSRIIHIEIICRFFWHRGQASRFFAMGIQEMATAEPRRYGDARDWLKFIFSMLRK